MVGTGWLSVPLCVQHVLFNPTVYHKVLAVSLENPPLLLVGVSQFLRALPFSAGLGGDEISNPAESLQEKSAFNYCPLLRAEVRGQEELEHGSPLSSCRVAEKWVASAKKTLDLMWAMMRRILKMIAAVNHITLPIGFNRYAVTSVCRKYKSQTYFLQSAISGTNYGHNNYLLNSELAHICTLYSKSICRQWNKKQKLAPPWVVSCDMMMWLCHDLMIDAVWIGLPFLRQNTKCQRLWGSKGKNSCNAEIWITASLSTEYSLRQETENLARNKFAI